MKRTFAIIATLIMTGLTSMVMALEGNQTTEDLLSKIDNAISIKNEVQQQRMTRADSLRSIAAKSNGTTRIEALHDLYALYESFQADSTLSILDQLEATPEYQTDSALQAYCIIARARTYGVMGLFANAYEQLQLIRNYRLKDQQRLNYYNACHAIYGWISDFSEKSQPRLSRNLRQRASSYHDSILALEPDANNRIIVRTNKMYDQELYRECIDTLQSHIEGWTPAQRVFAYSRIAQAYEQIGDEDNAIKYLALTALGDLQAGNTEYMALPILANHLFEKGDNERAYNYLLCSLEDATLCHAALRTIEASNIFPIIDRARVETAKAKQKVERIVFILLAFWGILLTVAIWGLARQHRRLKHTQHALYEANSRLKTGNIQLQNANLQLHENAKIKEEYIMQYLSRSRRYLGAMESFQRQMYRLLQAHQIEELSKQLKSTQVIADEQAHFYADFDEAFLKLYPSFIKNFNDLLVPEARITPKRGELLNTELRIFALIRLGETDSNQIAKFLGYSLTTIYNYRSRVRNDALDKDQFEKKVMML